MRRKSLRIVSFICLLLIISVIFSQTSAFKAIFGGFKYIPDMGVNAVRVATRASWGVYSASFISRIGGISFEKAARPDNNLTISSISLQYNPGEPDGQRLKAIINGKIITVPLYDWKLKPILLYAASKLYSCLSLYGTTGDVENDSFYTNEYNLIGMLSYNPAFKNTLVGLRLLQMDCFLRSLHYFDELPTYPNGNVIYGKGEDLIEKSPYPSYYKKTLAQFLIQFEQNDSFVIVDFPVDIRFKISGDQLEMTGELYIHFWKLKTDAERVEVTKDIWKRMTKGTNLKIGENGEYCGTLEDIITVSQKTFNSLDRAMVTHLQDFSDELHRNINLVEKINPVVYQCVRDVMRYAAFFRYCKEENPNNFNAIEEIISKIDITPNIETPNGLTKNE
jgi:hypothetical protein